ncbi:MAG TPA: alpha-1,4-glucan--maltose-1-phosphate maltosyltransferase [Burkholderiales bacterium]|nr:alpha-1,4-glucan--maltose-1-phosphate maltosyltransferase [Burkholderiales bacterium]
MSSTVTRSRSRSHPSPHSSSSLNKARPGEESRTAPARVVIESLRPQVDCGRYPVKRTVGESVLVEADVFTDGHDAVLAELLWRYAGEEQWQQVPMQFHGNDHWSAEFPVERLGRYEYTVRGWADPFVTWQRDLQKRKDAGQDLSIDFLIGAELADVPELRDASLPAEARFRAAMEANPPPPDPARVLTYERTLFVNVDPVRARFSTWYELFPRSVRGDGRHATFKDVAKILPEIEAMGFDVLYFPPIHPIGVTERKGRNNALKAAPGDVGSPWAIGAKEGGHKAIHPQLGSFDDFHALVKEAERRGISVALDIAFQCSPDHPYVLEHPEWFRQRPDGTVQYAENPPKKYQDIYPFDFESSHWRELWEELESVFEFWVGHGVKIFRVDNPHTKAFAFWEWCIGDLKARHPELIFLSEAFTRPRVMHKLAKLGFTQSYTYFAWRNSRYELSEYFTELTKDPSREYFRPNVWPNTPDILHETLQHGGRPAFIVRVVLAATLAANYGLYGPAYELMEHVPREPGSEEYLHSEKYEIRQWDRARSDSLAPLIARLNSIRKENIALQSDWSLEFHPTDNDQLLVYSKQEGENLILVAVNLDARYVQSGWIDFPWGEGKTYDVEDLLGGGRYTWAGRRNFVQLNPQTLPAHVFRVVRG